MSLLSHFVALTLDTLAQKLLQLPAQSVIGSFVCLGVLVPSWDGFFYEYVHAHVHTRVVSASTVMNLNPCQNSNLQLLRLESFHFVMFSEILFATKQSDLAHVRVTFAQTYTRGPVLRRTQTAILLSQRGATFLRAQLMIHTSKKSCNTRSLRLTSDLTLNDWDVRLVQIKLSARWQTAHSNRIGERICNKVESWHLLDRRFPLDMHRSDAQAGPKEEDDSERIQEDKEKKEDSEQQQRMQKEEEMEDSLKRCCIPPNPHEQVLQWLASVAASKHSADVAHVSTSQASDSVASLVYDGISTENEEHVICSDEDCNEAQAVLKVDSLGIEVRAALESLSLPISPEQVRKSTASLAASLC